MDAMLRMLLGLSLAGTVMALFLLLLRRVAGTRLPSAFYYCAWLLVLLRFVLPLPGLLPLSQSQPSATAPAALELPAAQVVQGEPVRPWQGADAGGEAPGGAAPAMPAVPAARPETNSRQLQWDMLRRDAAALLKSSALYLRLWLTGALLMAVYYALGYRRFIRELKISLRRPLLSDRELYEELPGLYKPALFRSRAVTTPMLVGVLRPILVLPDRAYDADMLRGIFLHELCHYRRRDVACKWFAVGVTVIHWFNPITRVLLRELDRSCELACDERLLRSMDRSEKQRYGELLLDLAAERRLPRSVVATSFAIEKRNLKERLVQIMRYKNRGRAGMALALAALLLLSGCAAALGPGGSAAPAESENSPALAGQVPPTPQPASEKTAESEPSVQYENAVTVTTVDELLAAIAPSTQIMLQPGLYDLSTAKDYGEKHDEGHYTWEEVYDGYELVIRDVTDLAILGGGAADVTLAATPRYANVLSFRDCVNPLVMMLTAGHTEEPGLCAGGVLDFSGCQSSYVLDCALYGCGILGVNANNCRRLVVRDTEIYECSYGAVRANSCYDVQVDNCEIRDCGKRDDMGIDCFSLFQSVSCTGFALINSRVHDNTAQVVLDARYSQETSMLGCEVESNKISNSIFLIEGAPPVVDGCAFVSNGSARFYPPQYAGYAVSPEGEDLISFDLERMSLKEAEYQGPRQEEQRAPEPKMNEEGKAEYTVSSVDEFLAALGPDRIIYLEEGQYDLSTAASYGGYGSAYYYWQAQFDGPSLVITGVSNLEIVGRGKDKTEIIAQPRYADVLGFVSGENIRLSGFTAGHTETGECAGNVLDFDNVSGLEIRDCGLFGCGVWGILAGNCYNVTVSDTEIYSCSSGAFTFFNTDKVRMSGLDIHDMRDPYCAFISECEDFLYDGKLLGDGSYKLSK